MCGWCGALEAGRRLSGGGAGDGGRGSGIAAVDVQRGKHGIGVGGAAGDEGGCRGGESVGGVEAGVGLGRRVLAGAGVGERLGAEDRWKLADGEAEALVGVFGRSGLQ